MTSTLITIDDIRDRCDAGVYETPLGEQYHHKLWRDIPQNVRDYMRSGREAFKRDLLEALEVSDHPKAEKFWEICYEEGHSEGYYGVINWAITLIELLV